MGKTILLGTTLAVLFAVFMIVPALAVGHLAIVEAVMDDDDEVEIKVTADIPTDGTGGAFGYGAFITDTTLVAVTTHGGVGPDSEEQEDAADPVFHSHFLVLTDNPIECNDFAIVSASFEDDADFEVEDNTVEIEDIEGFNGDVASFTLSVEPTGEICVDVMDTDVAVAEDDD